MRLRDLKGLGPKSEEMLAKLGVLSVDEFLVRDPFELYVSLKEKTPSVGLNMLYAMLGAQEGVSWQEVARQRRMEVLARLDDMGLAP